MKIKEKDMEPQPSTSGPTLSHYFPPGSNDFFDRIQNCAKHGPPPMFSMANAVFPKPGIKPRNRLPVNCEFFEEAGHTETDADLEVGVKVSEEARNFWTPPPTFPGVPPMLTMPGLFTPMDMPDMIADTVRKHLGEAELENRQFPTMDSVTQDVIGVRSLIKSGCYRAAVNLTGRLLTMYGQGYGRAGYPAKHSTHSLQLWFTRLSLLLKLGEFEQLQNEAEPFDQLTRPDVYYEFYPDSNNGKKGSMACFAFRLLLAELPAYYGNPQLALDRMTGLFVVIHEIKTYYTSFLQSAAAQFWLRREIRVVHAIINCAIIMKKFKLVNTLMHSLVVECPDRYKEKRRALFSAWGRIFITTGDIFGAEQKFAEARRLRDINSPPDLRDLVDKGLVAIARNDYPEAFAIFQKALPLEPDDTMILNNMGVCLLYAGKLKDAINLFERAIKLNPKKALNGSLLVNLSTLYELESNNSQKKKLDLLRLVNKYKPDLSLNLEMCLKLQNNIP